ncbi:hypothetical protein SCLCIDRAFT_1212243 [Scleroderma citrinum Foug A]|uniref:Uncharacterized protein n=1 Tax=Scleroderma citrinum Foug A TaxID=1036808 RepID=A0A0C3AKN5_9AGAM|nr:hypothetical protein SCLCIDRAFT_1212243 [Scleroderma citrinum Foug A]
MGPSESMISGQGFPTTNNVPSAPIVGERRKPWSILLECPHDQADIIWALAKSIWPMSLVAWPDIHLGTIPGCVLPSRQNNSRPDRGKSRPTSSRSSAAITSYKVNEREKRYHTEVVQQN